MIWQNGCSRSLGSNLATHSTQAKRPSIVQLISRDLMFALAHTEYLILMRKDALRPGLRKRLGSLRETRRSGGMDEQDSVPAVGYREGTAGYQDAVRYAYGLFNETIDTSALEPPALPSHVFRAWTANRVDRRLCWRPMDVVFAAF